MTSPISRKEYVIGSIGIGIVVMITAGRIAKARAENNPRTEIIQSTSVPFG